MQERYMGSITGDMLTTGKEVSFDRKERQKEDRKGGKNTTCGMSATPESNCMFSLPLWTSSFTYPATGLFLLKGISRLSEVSSPRLELRTGTHAVPLAGGSPLAASKTATTEACPGQASARQPSPPPATRLQQPPAPVRAELLTTGRRWAFTTAQPAAGSPSAP